MLRGFADTPREEGEVELRGELARRSHRGQSAGAPWSRIRTTSKQLRADGSYLGVNIGNFMISAGYMERWWGPGWDGSLILSTNARPIPSLTIERNYTDPFETKLLVVDRPVARQHRGGRGGVARRRACHEVRFLAARVNFKPRPWLEFGLTRTAQWCGGDRPCDWETFARHAHRSRQPSWSNRRARTPSPATRWRATTCGCARPGARCRWLSTPNG